MKPFEVISPINEGTPLVAHVPHAAIAIPEAVLEELWLTVEGLGGEVVRLTDLYTDELFSGLSELGATLFVNRLSRLVFDPERFLDDAMEPAAAVGQGVVYTHGSMGQPIRRVDTVLRARRIEEFYLPYHAALDSVVGKSLDAHGRCTVIDCHSFPSTPLRTELDQTPDRPDICIGTDEFHTPPDLAAGLEAGFAAEGFRVERNSPYAGTFVPSGYCGTDARVHSVMIEVRRGLYMDETTGHRGTRMPTVSAAITRAVAAAVGS